MTFLQVTVLTKSFMSSSATVFWMRACGQEPHKSDPYEELKETTKEPFTNSKIAKSMRPGGTAQK